MGASFQEPITCRKKKAPLSLVMQLDATFLTVCVYDRLANVPSITDQKICESAFRVSQAPEELRIAPQGCHYHNEEVEESVEDHSGRMLSESIGTWNKNTVK